MLVATDRPEASAAIRTHLGAIFVSLELSKSTWLVTSLLPGGDERMSRHAVRGGDIAGLLARFAQLREKAQVRTGETFPMVVIQEAGLDGFWIHRVLEQEGIESHVVDPASIATSRRRRRAKTDKIDGETLVRTLLAYKRGEPRVCAMAKPPTPEAEDRRRICRERKVLVSERTSHANRIKGLLFAQGITGYDPLRRDRRERLDDLRTGDGRVLGRHLKAQLIRELDRLELLFEQIKQSKPSETRCWSPKSLTRLWRCCSTSMALAPRVPPSCIRKGCSESSTTEGRLQRMQGLRRHLGGADQSTASKASQRLAIPG